MLDSILGLPSQIISTTGGLLNNIIAIPGQLVSSVSSSIGAVSNVAGQTVQGIANVAGNTVQGVASTATDLLSSPVVIIGIGIVLVILLKNKGMLSVLLFFIIRKRHIRRIMSDLSILSNSSYLGAVTLKSLTTASIYGLINKYFHGYD